MLKETAFAQNTLTGENFSFYLDCTKVFKMYSIFCQMSIITVIMLMTFKRRGHAGTVVTHLPPTSEVGTPNSEPYLGKMVVSYQWSALYKTEP